MKRYMLLSFFGLIMLSYNAYAGMCNAGMTGCDFFVDSEWCSPTQHADCANCERVQTEDPTWGLCCHNWFGHCIDQTGDFFWAGSGFGQVRGCDVECSV